MGKIEKISILTLGALAILGTSVFGATGKVDNTSQGLVFRKEASKVSEPLGTLENGTTVEIIEEDGEWYKVKYNNKEGYLFAEYVKVEETAETDSNIVDNKDKTNGGTQKPVTENLNTSKKLVVSSDIKIYIMPIITSSITGNIKAGAEITIEKQLNNWAYVTSGKKSGWIRTYNLSNEPVQENEENNTEEVEEEQNGEQQETTSTLSYGYINESSVNVRKEPSTSSEVLTTLILNTGVHIVAETDEWYKITYDDYEGYIAKRLISEKAKTTSRSSKEERSYDSWNGYISVSVANVRKDASTSSDILTTLNQKAEVKVVGEKSDFYAIDINNKTAYVSKTLIVDSLDKIVEMKVETPSNNDNESKDKEEDKEEANTIKGNAKGEEIVSFAKKYLGYSYVYGGTTPKSGFDCSGFIYYVFNSCGYSISRSCSTQAKTGTAVSKSELQLGDVIFFDNTSNGSIGHVGIYVGDGKFIHAANPKRGVVYDTINSGYYNTYYHSARRIVN